VLSFIKNFFNRSTSIEVEPSSIEEFLKQIELDTEQKDLYEKALTHGSFVKTQTSSNERLEFVGDAILGAAIADILYNFFPDKNEGKLSKMRSKLVSREALNQLGILLGIPKYLKHKIGKTEFRDSNNYVGNAFEALIGAIYLDKGYEFTHRFVLSKVITPFTDLEKLDAEIKDFKSYLIIWAQKGKHEFDFKVHRQSADAEEARFVAKLYVDGTYISEGVGRNKKTAQQKASQDAIKILNITEDSL
jgi:ribonuclease-3